MASSDSPVRGGQNKSIIFYFNLLSRIFGHLYISVGVAVTDIEAEKDQDATVSCTVSGVTAEPGIVWKNSDGTDLSSDSTNYGFGGTGFDSGSNTHESTLTVRAAKNDADALYTCFVTSSEWAITDEANTVNLKVLGKYFSLLLSYLSWL